MLEGARPKSLSARAGTFNWPARYTVGGPDADVALAGALFAEASVWGFQEAAWLPGKLPPSVGWHVSNDSAGKRNGQVLAWDEGMWREVRSGSWLISPATVIQREAAGPQVHREKHVVWADLGHIKTGAVIRFGVLHLVPSKHLGGAALELWRRQRDGAIAWMRSSPHPTVLLGDFNAEPSDQVAKPLVDAAGGVLSGPSMGKRAIDWVVYGKSLTGGAVRVLPDTRQSDHRPVVGTVVAP